MAVVEPAPGVRYPQSGEEAEAAVLLAVLGPLVPEAPEPPAEPPEAPIEAPVEAPTEPEVSASTGTR